MQKYILLISAILLFSSCQQYRYEVFYKRCNGNDNYIVSYTGKTEPYILNSGRGVPELRLTYGYTRFDYYRVLNICDFSYTRTPLTK